MKLSIAVAFMLPALVLLVPTCHAQVDIDVTLVSIRRCENVSKKVSRVVYAFKVRVRNNSEHTIFLPKSSGDVVPKIVHSLAIQRLDGDKWVIASPQSDTRPAGFIAVEAGKQIEDDAWVAPEGAAQLLPGRYRAVVLYSKSKSRRAWMLVNSPEIELSSAAIGVDAECWSPIASKTTRSGAPQY